MDSKLKGHVIYFIDRRDLKGFPNGPDTSPKPMFISMNNK